MDNKPVRYLRLKDNHPTLQKLDKIFALAEELGIRIDFSSHGPAQVYDNERDKSLPVLSLQDIESSDYPMDNFPPTLEFKVIYQNPAYLEACRIEEEERKEKARLAAEARSEAAKKAAETRRKQERSRRIAELEERTKREQAELDLLLKEEDE